MPTAEKSPASADFRLQIAGEADARSKYLNDLTRNTLLPVFTALTQNLDLVYPLHLSGIPIGL